MKEDVKGKKRPETEGAMKLRRQGRSQTPAEGGNLGKEGEDPRTDGTNGTDRTEAAKLRRQVRSQVQLGNEGKEKRTQSEAMRERWRKIRAGLLPNPNEVARAPRRSVNPLLDLSEEQRAKLFAWLRECPYDDAVQHMLRDQGIAEATSAQLNDFFQHEAEQHWEKRIERAAQEANALVQLVEKSPVKFSSGILAALGQEAFRQIASGQVEPDAMGKLATLFLRARSDERADQMQELKREKLRHELQGQIDHALEKLAEEVDRHPVAREAFEALRKELATSMEEAI
jgi:hypothetical protein